MCSISPETTSEPSIDGSASRSPSVWTLCRTARSSWGEPCFPHEPPSFRLANATGSSAPGGTRSRLRAQASLDQGRDQGRTIQPADSECEVENGGRPKDGCVVMGGNGTGEVCGLTSRVEK